MGLRVMTEEGERKPNGLDTKKNFGVPRATAFGKDLRREKMFFRNIAIDHELDKI